MNTIDISAAAVTDSGKVRTNNEDNFFFNGTFLHNEDGISHHFLAYQGSDFGFSCAVFDGMGGEACGEVASETAACVFSDFFGDNAGLSIEEQKEKLCRFYLAANDRIRAFSDTIKATAGCTAATLSIAGDRAVISNIGDSRIFLIRDNSIVQLSEDHTLSALMVRSGAMTEEQARNSMGSHTLLRFLGAPPDEFDCSPYFGDEITLADGDCFILCSDGLTDTVLPSELLGRQSEFPEPQELTKKLLGEALDNGGKDNCTIIVIKITMRVR